MKKSTETLEIQTKDVVKTQGTKVCKKCSVEKPYALFKKNKECRNGVANVCVACENIRLAEWAKNNRERKLKHQAKNRINRKEQNKLSNLNYVEKNKEKVKQYQSNFKKINRHLVIADARKRRTRSKLAFVSWANKKSISTIYAISKFLTDVVGVQYHVDHVIPLQGKLVSGLHVENNLAIIRAEQNLSKGNLYEPR